MKRLRSSARYCVPRFAGAGVAGCGEVEPAPVVLGGVTLRIDMLPLVIGAGLLLAVLLLLFQAATTMNAISTSTVRLAIQLHIPPTPPSRRSTGSVNRGSPFRGSVKRGSVMAILLGFETRLVVSNGGKPRARPMVAKKSDAQCSYTDCGFVNRTANIQASQNTKKKQPRNTGKLAVSDQCSTVRPMA